MHWIYHPLLGAKLVPTSEYVTHLSQGWYDSPAKFPKKETSNEKTVLQTHLALQPQENSHHLAHQKMMKKRKRQRGR